MTKITRMKEYVIDAVTYSAPQYVLRLPHGWQVRPRGIPSVSFADSTYGGPAESLQRAIAHLNSLNLQVVSPSIFAHELDTKASKLGSRGISLVKRLDPRRPNIEQYVFHVIMHGLKRANVYIGTEATWRANYAAKLLEARALRFNSFCAALGEAEALRIVKHEAGADQCAPLQEANDAPRRRSVRP